MIVAIVAATVMLATFFIAFGTAEAAPGGDTAADICSGVTAVPPQECSALVDLYTQTAGCGWTSRAHWLDTGSSAAPRAW